MALVTANFIFIHVPKTGGTWIRRQIEHNTNCRESGEYNIEDHFGVREVRENHPELKALPCYGFVRHPLTWYASRWAWAVLTNFGQKIQDPQHPGNSHWMASVWSNTFSTFIDLVVDRGEPHAWFTFRDKLYYNKEWCFVGRYEELVADFQRFTGLTAIAEIAPQNVGAKKLLPVYTPDQAKKICDLEEQTIWTFYTDACGEQVPPMLGQQR